MRTAPPFSIRCWHRTAARERRPELLDALQERHGYRLERIVDLTALEDRGMFLEGTGSLVLDRARRIAYACRSPRTHPEALAEFGRRLDYEIVAFDAVDRGTARSITRMCCCLSGRASQRCARALFPTRPSASG